MQNRITVEQRRIRLADFPNYFNVFPVYSVSMLLHPSLPLKSGSPLAQVMACCLAAPSHFLNQCWLIRFCVIPTRALSQRVPKLLCCIMNFLKNHNFRITAISPKSHWALPWSHIEHEGVLNHRRIDYLFNRLFRRRPNKISKLSITGLCAGNSPVTGEFPAQMASYAENVSIWWRHHVIKMLRGQEWPCRHLAVITHNVYRMTWNII